MGIKVLDMESQPEATKPAAKLDTDLLQAIQRAAHEAAKEAGERAFGAAEAATKKIMADVEKRLNAIEAPRPQIMAVSIDNETRKLSSPACKALPRMIVNAKTGINTLLVGPAGCGKTFAAHQLAEALGLPYGHVCFTAGASETWLFGRQTPNGFIEGTFSRMYREGGVFLGDELDAADANMLLAVNTALANGSLFNPINGETYKKHENFVFVGAANTVGKGGDHVYTGRSRLDGSTLNRFSGGMIQVDYDAEVERQLCPDADLYNAIRAARDQLRRLKSDEIISTRTFDNAYRLMAAGVDVKEIFASITLGWPDDLIRQAGLHKFERKSKPALTTQAETTEEAKPDTGNAAVDAAIAANNARIEELKRKLASRK